MERRELLSLGGLAAIAGAFGTAVAQEPGAGKKVIRIYADAEGNSHVQELPIATKAGKVRRTDTAPVTGFIYADYTASSLEDWHRTPRRRGSSPSRCLAKLRSKYPAAKSTPSTLATWCSSKTCKVRVTSPAF
jgi:hypothetical protein